MKRLSKETLLNLLEMYEAAIRELEKLHDPSVTDLLRRMERHRAEIAETLAAQTPAA